MPLMPIYQLTMSNRGYESWERILEDFELEPPELVRRSQMEVVDAAIRDHFEYHPIGGVTRIQRVEYRVDPDAPHRYERRRQPYDYDEVTEWHASYFISRDPSVPGRDPNKRCPGLVNITSVQRLPCRYDGNPSPERPLTMGPLTEHLRVETISTYDDALPVRLRGHAYRTVPFLTVDRDAAPYRCTTVPPTSLRKFTTREEAQLVFGTDGASTGWRITAKSSDRHE